MKHENVYLRIYRILFHLTLSYMLIEWVFPMPILGNLIGLYEAFFVLHGVFFLICVWKDRVRLMKRFFEIMKASRYSAIFLTAYLIMGVVTLFYALDPAYAALKYVTVIQMMVFFVSFLYYVCGEETCNIRAHLSSIYLNLGITAVVISLRAVLDHFFGGCPIYFQRISPIVDYNQYSTILLAGYVCISMWLIGSQMKRCYKYPALGLSSCAIVPAVFISGSRRSYLILLAVSVLCICACAVCEFLQYRKNKSVKILILSLCAVAVCAGCTQGCVSWLTTATQEASIVLQEKYFYEFEAEQNEMGLDFPADFDDADENGHLNESSLDDVYQTISNGSAMSKRNLIWSAAIEKIKSSDLKHILVGYGASYSSDLYDDPTNEHVRKVSGSYTAKPGMKKAHWMNTHNIFLQDMLEGGVVLLGLQLALIISLGVYTVYILLKNPIQGLTVGLLYVIIFVTLMMSSGKGMIDNKLFWLALMLQTAEVYGIKRKIHGES